jgi:hypothetical protein
MPILTHKKKVAHQNHGLTLNHLVQVDYYGRLETNYDVQIYQIHPPSSGVGGGHFSLGPNLSPSFCALGKCTL